MMTDDRQVEEFIKGKNILQQIQDHTFLQVFMILGILEGLGN